MSKKEYTVHLYQAEIEDIQKLLYSKGFALEGKIDRDQTVMLWGLLNQILLPELRFRSRLPPSQ